MSPLRIATPLPAELEELVRRTIGCCVQVHRSLGLGLLEHIYAKAMALELAAGGLTFDSEKAFPVYYRDQLLCHQRVDLVVERKVLLEIRATDGFDPVHRAQILSYLRVSGIRVGLLVNFNVPVIPAGLKRFIL
jgi:GxxExxY protein